MRIRKVLIVVGLYQLLLKKCLNTIEKLHYGVKSQKNMKRRRSLISSSPRRILTGIPGNCGIPSVIASSPTLTASSPCRPFVMPQFSDPSGCDINERRRIRKEKRYLFRQGKVRYPSARERSGMCASDASLYLKSYNDATRFIVCAIYGHEGSFTGSKTLVEYEGMIKNSGLKERFLNLTSVGAYSTAYDIIFIEELKSYSTMALLKV